MNGKPNTRMLKGVTNARLHGNDVTIYSCLLGNYFAGVPLEARFNENYDGPMTFVKDYMKTDLDIVTVVLLLSKMAVYLGSKPNPHYLNTSVEQVFKNMRDNTGGFLFAAEMNEHGTLPLFVCQPRYYSRLYRTEVGVNQRISRR